MYITCEKLGIFRNKLFKVLPCGSDVELSQRGGDLRGGARHDDHDVGVAGEHVDEGGELRVAHLHTAELRLRLGAADLELLDDVGDALEPVAVVVVRSVCKKRRQNNMNIKS